MDDLRHALLGWYAANARDLPWRRPEATAWSVLVSEFMLQQTPVARVLPVHEQWLERWPTPAALAEAPVGEAVRSWGRLGYPRRSLRLHAAAQAVVERHRGQIPSSIPELRALPGVGEYTASAVAAFSFGERCAVLDTNVRRVLGRAFAGRAQPPSSLTRAERDLAESVLPTEQAPTWSVALMELGALVCTARSPRCSACPIASACAWRLAGSPAYAGPARRAQGYAGTDRQARGRILALVRESAGPVPRARIEGTWPDPDQRQRALAGLIIDGLVVEVTGATDLFALPS